ncbi:MAG: type II CRISPR RNA-guided endonuclease Cas9 [Muribaculaceae bacterium]|nr:type II CRISPR RNA-guided endonuclease Cas9 [Muribaculaceae bacterium]
MKRILGLDLGTTSIGWAVVDQATEPNETSKIIKLGVRVNPLTVDEKGNFEKGKPITTTADRTLKRGMRRNLSRYKQRRQFLISVLKQEGFIPKDFSFSEQGNASTFQTYRLRAKAASEPISLEELARVLLMLNKKRGYKSNRKASDSDDGQLVDGMDIARKLYDEGLTPGQFVLSTLSAKNRHIPSFYRSDLQQEYDSIWAQQKKYYPQTLTEELKKKLEGRSKKKTAELFYAIAQVSTAENKDKDKLVRLRRAYSWRVDALSQKMDLDVIAYVLGEINGQIDQSSGYLGSISDNSKELYFNHLTVGQFLMKGLDENPHFRIKNRVFYRQDYLNEFNTIWETQAKYHPQLTEELKTKFRDIIIFYQRRLKSKKGLIAYCELEGKRITINERGKTRQVISGPRVCPKSSPVFQEFKIWQNINALRLTAKDNPSINIALKSEQRTSLFKELQVNKSIKANAILKLLGLKAKDYDLNFDELQGNLTIVAFIEAFKTIIDWTGHDVENFDKLPADKKLQLISAVLTEAAGAKPELTQFDLGCNSDPQNTLIFRLWHLLYSYEGDNSSTGNENIVRHIQTLTGLSAEHARLIANINFGDDYGSISTKAITKLMPFLREGFIYSDACAKAGYNHSKQSITSEQNETRLLAPSLEILSKNSLRNPVVEKILNQMIHVVNDAMRVYGVADSNGVKRFDEIHLEMARSLKQTQKQRELATSSIKARTSETEAIVERLQNGKAEFGINIPHPSRNDILRVKLYDELKDNGFHTLYSNTYIPKERLFDKDFDIEHIIPQAMLFDDSQSNKTLELRSINIEKGNKTAFDYVREKWGEDGLEQYKQRIAFMQTINKSKHRNLLTKADEIEQSSGFINRDLNDTQYIARKAKELLLQVTRTVIPTSGAITARLRYDWELVDLMKEINWNKYDQLGLTETYRNRDGHEVRRIKEWTKRNDHRHHAMDALTIAFTRLEHIQYLNNLSGNEQHNANTFALKKKLIKDRRFVPPMPSLRTEAKSQLEAIFVSIKAKNKVATPRINHPKGSSTVQVSLTPRTQLHNETIYGQRQRYVTKVERVDASFNEEKIATVARAEYRNALLSRLLSFQGDAKKAFTGKNALDKNPIWLNEQHTSQVPQRVKTVSFETIFTVRKPITKDLNIDKVVDEGIKRILLKRVEEYGSKANAFANLEENPIWLNKQAGIAINHVTITGVAVATSLHKKLDKDGQPVLDDNGNPIPNDFVSTSNNHHVAIFEDKNGKLQEHIVSYFEAIARLNAGLPIVDRQYRSDDGWRFLFTMKNNEYFVFPNLETGFDPTQADLMNPVNIQDITANLFRVQKLSSSDYWFRHQYETNVEDAKELRNITWKRIQNPNGLNGIVKVRLNHIGQIVDIGEY